MLIQDRLVAYGSFSTLGISTYAINPKGFYVTSGKGVHLPLGHFNRHKMHTRYFKLLSRSTQWISGLLTNKMFYSMIVEDHIMVISRGLMGSISDFGRSRC